MIRSALITLIGQRLGNRTGLDAVILSEMDMVQQTALERNGRIVPWFLETERAEVTTTADEERIAVPTDFAMEKEDGLWLYRPSESKPWRRLAKKDYEYLLDKYHDDTGAPEGYSLGGSYFRLRPIPDAGYTLRMIYAATQTLPSALAAGGENAWMKYAPDLVAAATAQQIARFHIQDLELAAMFDQEIQRAWDRVNVETEAQQHTARSYQMGES